MPVDVKPRILTTAINDDDNTASLALALDVADYFELDAAKARAIAAAVGKVVSKWRQEAAGDTTQIRVVCVTLSCLVAPIMAGPRERAGWVKTAQRRREVLTRPSAPE
jgi:hypothetical protein